MHWGTAKGPRYPGAFSNYGTYQWLANPTPTIACMGSNPRLPAILKHDNGMFG